MRISGNEPSSVILRQTKWFQKLKMSRKCQNKLKPNGMMKKNTQNYNFNQFVYEKF